MLKGYDIDGVISLGLRPAKIGSVIITGRSYQEAELTNQLLKGLDIDCPIYFAPWEIKHKTRLKSAEWKEEIIRRLGVERFFEDDPIQFDYIKLETNDLELDLIHIKHNQLEIY